MASTTLEEVKKVSADLHKALVKAKDGTGTREEVRAAAEDLLMKRGGYKPRVSEPDPDTSPNEGLEEIHKARGYRADSANVEIQKRAEFQRVSDDVFILNGIMKLQAIKRGEIYNIRKRATEHPGVRLLLRRLQVCRKAAALNSTTAGSGDEWVPTLESGQFYDFLRLKTAVWNLFEEVSMPSDPFTLPTKTAGSKSYLRNEATTDAAQKARASSVTTASVSLASKEHATRVLYSDIVDEDSIIPILPMLRDDMMTGLAEGMESALINGDTAATHQDNATVTKYQSYEVEVGHLGLRAWAIDQSNTTGFTGTAVKADWRAGRKSMGKWGLEPSELAWITSPKGYFLALDHFLDEISTIDKFGPQARILTGQLAAIDGTPLIVSGQAGEDLNASGLYDGTTVDNTFALLVRTDSFKTGFRRGVKIETDRDIETGQNIVVATARPALINRYATSADPIWYLYDLD